MRVVFATGNEGKMVEIREIMHDFLIKHDIELVSLKEADIHADIVEDGNTFEENAVIKAKEIAKLTSDIVLADDSGWRLISLIKLREYTHPDFWAKILLIQLKIIIFLISLRKCLRIKERRGLYVL